MLKNKTIFASLTYSRQTTQTKEHTISLLEELENALEVKNLSKMRDPVHIVERINNAEKTPNHIRLNVFG